MSICFHFVSRVIYVHTVRVWVILYIPMIPASSPNDTSSSSYDTCTGIITRAFYLSRAYPNGTALYRAVLAVGYFLFLQETIKGLLKASSSGRRRRRRTVLPLIA